MARRTKAQFEKSKTKEINVLMDKIDSINVDRIIDSSKVQNKTKLKLAKYIRLDHRQKNIIFSIFNSFELFNKIDLGIIELDISVGNYFNHVYRRNYEENLINVSFNKGIINNEFIFKLALTRLMVKIFLIRFNFIYPGFINKFLDTNLYLFLKKARISYADKEDIKDKKLSEILFHYFSNIKDLDTYFGLYYFDSLDSDDEKIHFISKTYFLKTLDSNNSESYLKDAALWFTKIFERDALAFSKSGK